MRLMFMAASRCPSGFKIPGPDRIVAELSRSTGLGRAAQKPAWLVERTGFELPRPVHLGAGTHGLNPACDEWPRFLLRRAICHFGTSFDIEERISTKP